MRNASQEHERVVGCFPIFSIDSVGVFLPNPEPEIKTSLTYTTATFHSVEKSALAQGLSAPHHHSLAPSSITINLPVPAGTSFFRVDLFLLGSLSPTRANVEGVV